jgi:leader peptidase (prepilin peptidase)/N-methyltransferase
MGLEASIDPGGVAAMPLHFWSAVFFVLGCVVGSFLNVVIHRLPLGESIVTPPSHCPHCRYSIPWYLNIPLLTWLWLQGKCRNCGAPIAFRYFAVELLTAVAFLGCWLMFGGQSPAQAVVYCVFVAGLIAASFIDDEHMIVPDEITLGGVAVGVLASIFIPALHAAPSPRESLGRSLLGAACGTALVYVILRLGKLFLGRHKLPLAADSRIVFTETGLVLPDREIPYEDLFYRKSDAVIVRARTAELVDRSYKDVTLRLAVGSLTVGDDTFDPEAVPHLEAVASEILLPREAMGLGDVKFMAAVGAFLGWKATIFSLFGSAVIGSLVAGGLYVVRWGKGSRQVAYIPYLAAAAVLWLLAGPRIWDWVFRLR